MVTAKTLAGPRSERYAGWDGDLGRAILAGELSLEDLDRKVGDEGLDPKPHSGAQEQLEGAVNRRIWRAGAGR
jgi:xylose isomerase